MIKLIVKHTTQVQLLLKVQIFTQACADLGVPLAAEKAEGPSTQLTFLEILLDTNRIEIRLPNDKLQCIRTELASWLQKESLPNEKSYFW